MTKDEIKALIKSDMNSVPGWDLNSPYERFTPFISSIVERLTGSIDIVDEVINIINPANGLPVNPVQFDRYLSDNTGNGWQKNYLYEWSGTAWVGRSLVDLEGVLYYVKASKAHFYFDGINIVRAAGSGFIEHRIQEHSNFVEGCCGDSGFLLKLAGNDLWITWDPWEVYPNGSHGNLVENFNADKLDGYDAAYFAMYNHLHDTRYSQLGHPHVSTDITNFTTAVQTIGDARYSLLSHYHTQLQSTTHTGTYYIYNEWIPVNGTYRWRVRSNHGDNCSVAHSDLATSATNSDMLDGLHYSQLFNNCGQNHTNYTNFNTLPDFGIYYVNGTTNAPSAATQYYGFNLGLGNDYVYAHYASQLYWGRIVSGGDNYIYLRDREAGTWGSWRKIGAGYADSAGNADTLDNLHYTSFLRKDQADTFSSDYYWRFNVVGGRTISYTGGTGSSLEIYQPTQNADAFLTFHIGSDYALYFGLDGTTNDLAVGGWSMGGVKYKIWHAGNDGSGSGLDADYLDGLNSSAFSMVGHNHDERYAEPLDIWGFLYYGDIGFFNNTTFDRSNLSHTTLGVKICRNDTPTTTATPSKILFDRTYSNGKTKESLKIALYEGPGGDKYGFTIGNAADIQYHSDGYHDFYYNNYRMMSINNQSLNLGNQSDPSTDQGDVWITWGKYTNANPYYAIRTNYKTYGSYTYTRLQVGWHTGIEIGADYNYGGIRFFNNSPFTGTQQVSFFDGDNWVRIAAGLHVGLNNGNSCPLIIGPNSTWNQYLYIGGWNDTDFSVPRIQTSNGNLHLDSKTGCDLYINWYGAKRTLINNNLSVGGVDPLNTHTNYRSIRLGNSFSMMGQVAGVPSTYGSLWLGHNTYYHTDSTWKALYTGIGIVMGMSDSGFSIDFAASANAGTTHTFYSRFMVDSGGNVLAGRNLSGATITPCCIDTGLTYSSNSQNTSLKIKLYTGFGFTVGSSSDVQYHTYDSSGKHDFYIGNVLKGRITNTYSGFWTSANVGMEVDITNGVGLYGTTHVEGLLNVISTAYFYGAVYMPGIIQTGVYGYDLVCSQSEKQVAWYNSSIRFKENVRNAETDWLYDIKVRMYDRKDKSMKDEFGIIAEELNEIRPDFILKDKNGQIETYSSRPLLPAAINEIQNLKKLIDTLYSKIEKLEGKK